MRTLTRLTLVAVPLLLLPLLGCDAPKARLCSDLVARAVDDTRDEERTRTYTIHVSGTQEVYSAKVDDYVEVEVDAECEIQVGDGRFIECEIQ